MQTQTFNQIYNKLNNANRFKQTDIDNIPKIDRRISIDTYNLEKSETDNFEDELLGKRTFSEDKKPAFEVYCENYGINNSGEYIRKLEERASESPIYLSELEESIVVSVLV